MVVTPVILCGGGGLRLWPVSRPERPKPFVPLLGARSSFQATAARLAPLAPGGELIVIAGVAHQGLIEAQLADLGLSARLILEPEGRDSTAALAAGALAVAEGDPDAVLAFIASDHHVADDAAFIAAVARAAGFAEREAAIVTLGVAPTGPASAYGYIDAGPEAAGAEGVRPVRRFVEKPTPSEAAALVAAGLLWNSGNFVVSARTLIAELERFAPDTLATVRTALADASGEARARRLGEVFRTAPRHSFDRAVMEKTDRAAVLPVSFGWSDLGAWDAVGAAAKTDPDGNAGPDGTVFEAAERVLVHAPAARRVAVIGVRDLAVVADGDDLLVCDLAQAQSVKRAAKAFLSRPVRAFADLPAAAAAYHAWFETAALPLWASLGADHANWGFHESLDGAARPRTEPRRLRVQARQATVFAWAGRAGWRGPWAAAARAGSEAVLSRFRRGDGLFRFSVDAAGAPVDDGAYLYEQAFTLLHLAALHAAPPSGLPSRASLLAEAHALRERLEAFRAPDGGFLETGEPGRVTNPHMHLFESALAWAETAPGAEAEPWDALADEVAELVLDRAIDPRNGAIYEVFEAGWRRPAAGGEIWPGHQFEWAWLLSRWAVRRGRPEGMEAAKRMFAVGERGVDPRRGAAVAAMSEAFDLTDLSARVWPQTERLKAAVTLGEAASALEAANALWTYLATPIRGLWRERSGADGGFLDEPSPASSLYHIAGAILALVETAAI